MAKNRFLFTLSLLLGVCYFPSVFSYPKAHPTHYFWVISDIHLDTAKHSPMDIEPTSPSIYNDLDVAQFKKMIEVLVASRAAGSIPEPDFIVLLGDLVGHRRANALSVKFSLEQVTQTFFSSFPATPIVYNFGNNDSFESNYGPFTADSPDGDLNSPWHVFHQLNPLHPGFILNRDSCNTMPLEYPCTLDENTVNGYYSAMVAPRLRLISLNSVMLANKSKGVTEHESKTQLNWLQAQLHATRSNQERVLMLMHVPPGFNVHDDTNFWKDADLKVFLALISSFHEVIMGILSGHTHMDEIKSITHAENATGVFLNPALSTAHGNAAAMRVYRMDDQSQYWQLSDYTTYHFTKSELGFITLEPLYTYKKQYCSEEEGDIQSCLSRVNSEKMARYFSAGNPSFSGVINWPDNIQIRERNRNYWFKNALNQIWVYCTHKIRAITG